MQKSTQSYFSSPPTHQLLRTQVYEYLRNELKIGNLKPGMFISTNQLMKDLGISRTPFRDALLQLQFEGFVTFLPQRGIQINEITQQDIQHIYEIIGGLDSRTLIAVASEIGAEEIDQMESINQEMIGNISKDQFNHYWELNTAFHLAYLHLSSNTAILNQISTLRQRLFEFGKKDWTRAMRELNHSEHLEIIELIKKGEKFRAADFIRDVHCVINF